MSPNRSFTLVRVWLLRANVAVARGRKVRYVKADTGGTGTFDGT